MFEDVVSPHGAPAGKRRMAAGPAAILLHALVLGGALASALLNGEDLTPPDPPVPIAFALFSEPQAGPPPSHGGPRQSPGPSNAATAAADTVSQTVSPDDASSAETFDVSQGVWSESDTGIGDPFGDSLGISCGTGEAGWGSGAGGGGDNPIYELTREITPPRLIDRVDPVYPETLRKLRIQGVVIARAIIGADGRIEDLTILKALHPMADAAVLDAVRRWRYEPGRLSGRIVRVALTVTVDFALH